MLRSYLARIGLAGSLVFALGLSEGWTQPPPDGGGGFPGNGRERRGGGKGGGKGFDPGMRFDAVANGRTSVPLNEIPVSQRDPNGAERLQQWAAQNGITNGQITRDQYVSYVQQRIAEFRANGGGRGGPGGGPPGGPPPAASPAVPGGSAPVPPADGAAPAPGAPPADAPPPEEEEKKPTFHRPGKLPKGLPDWFAKLDTDQDGQVGLYEWKEAGRPLDEFRKLDRNGDGFITVEEALHSAKSSGNGVASSNQTGTPRSGEDSAEESSSNRPTATASAGSQNNGNNRSRRFGNNNGRFNGGNRRSSGKQPNNGGNGHGGNDDSQGNGNGDN
jgi:hypothetical protein